MDTTCGAYRERRFTSHDGLSLYFRDYGDPLSAATPVACLGGLARNSKDYEDLAPRLADERRVLCPDYRGRGRSDYDPDWCNYRADVYLADLGDLLTVAGLHRVVVIGTSLGGLLAMALAVTRPTALAGVVLNDIGPDIGAGGVARIAAYLRAHAHQPDWASAISFLKQSYNNPAIASDDDWMRIARRTYCEEADGRLRSDFDPAIERAFARDARAVPDLWPLFRSLRHVPVLAFRGAVSDVLSSETFDRMAEEIPDLVRITVPGTGHVPTLDEPECVSAIDEFLARV